MKRYITVSLWGEKRALKRKPNPRADDGSQEKVKRFECYHGVQIFGNLEDLKMTVKG